MIFTRLTTSVGVITLPGDRVYETAVKLGIKVYDVQKVIVTTRNAA